MMALVAMSACAIYVVWNQYIFVYVWVIAVQCEFSSEYEDGMLRRGGTWICISV